VYFFDHQSIDVAKAAMHQADAGFVSLLPDMYRYAYPSKTMTYLEQGCPLIVAVEPESELARDVVNGGYGYCVPVGDSQVLATLLARLANDLSWKASMREKAILKATTDFSESVLLEEWTNIVNKSTDY
jgi:glycosyltransferase involved in cell wall biosynthesis